MSIHLACSSCGYAGQVADNLAGKTLLCPKCRVALPIPHPEPVLALSAAAVSMPGNEPEWIGQFIRMLGDRGILESVEIGSVLKTIPAAERGDILRLTRALAQQQKLSWFQAALLAQGKAEELVLGNYVLLDKLGEGGMGAVFKARHRKMQRLVALKALLPEVTRNPHARQRFQREVQVAAKLSHPNIVTAHDADEARGTHFLVMEFVDGPDLGRLVKKQGPLPSEMVIDYVLQAARGLAHAHAADVIHRDIKPSNLLLDKKGVVKISDLGLARAVQTECGSGIDALTNTKAVLGTVDYMAPEQAFNTKNVDHRADIYSLGCTLYALATAHSLYTGNSAMEIMLAHREHAIPSLPASCGSLQPIFGRMVAKRMEDRYASMAQVITDLERHATPNLLVPAYSRGGSEQPLSVEKAVSVEPASAQTLGGAGAGTMMADISSQSVNRPSWLESATAMLVPEQDKGKKLPWIIAGAGVAALLLLVLVGGLAALLWRGKGGSLTEAASKIGAIPNQPDPEQQKLDSLFAAIAKGVRGDETKRSNTLGGAFADQLFDETPPEGALLIGFEFGEMAVFAKPVIGYVRPIFLTAKGERLGNEYGKRPDKTRVVKAKPGYAVGAIKAAGGGMMHGISLTFMKLIPEQGMLDPNDSYESKWSGYDEEHAQRLDSNRAMVVGVAGVKNREGLAIRLGLMTLRVQPSGR